jgi:hypothetical protein
VGEDCGSLILRRPYTRDEVNVWEGQQSRRDAEGVVSGGEGKGKAGPGKIVDGADMTNAAAQPMDTDA